jgi:anaerobic dimethyl sulfoxide reductase subunit C (anchor subunit)
MEPREWALIVFTILGQLAAGAMLVVMILRAFATAKAGVKEADRFTDGPLYMVFPIMGLALLSSLLHLNNLKNIVGAVPNLATSWMSREVIISVTFIVVVGIFTVLQWRKIGSATLRDVIGWIAALIGVMQVYAMGLVYMIRTQPAWNTIATPISFMATALLLGVLAVAIALVINYRSTQGKDAVAAEKQAELLHGALQGIAIAAIILLGVEFLVLPLYVAYLGTYAAESLAKLTTQYGLTLALRLILVFLGAGVLAAYLYRNASAAGKEKTLAVVTYCAFLLVLAAEVMGRFLFYVSHVRYG